jgi:hypothetical protein
MRALFASAAVAFSIVVSLPAHADEAADTATARALGTEGFVLADAGHCSDAVEKLARAERLHHAPTTATRLAECEIETGKLVVGTERLQRVVREVLPPNAHPAFGAAQTHAREVLDRTLPRVPTLRLTVKTPGPRPRLFITIDGETTTDAIVGADRRIDPGPHTIVVSAEGHRPQRVQTTIEEGETKPVAIELVAVPSKSVDKAASAPPDVVTPTRSRAPAVAMFVVGGLGLAAGVVGGINVATKSYALDDACSGYVCPSERDNDIREAKTWATISTVGFVAAGVGLAGGILWLATAPSSSTSPTRASIRPGVGFASVGLSGEF